MILMEQLFFEFDGLFDFHMAMGGLGLCCGTLVYQSVLPYGLTRINIK